VSLNKNDPEEMTLMFNAMIGDPPTGSKNKRRLADKMSNLVLWGRDKKFYRLVHHSSGDSLATVVSFDDGFPMPALVLPAEELERIGYCRTCGKTADDLDEPDTGSLIGHYLTCAGGEE
jgi:hypothetical protein